MFKKVLSVSMFLAVQSAFAAIPPMSPEVRAMEASHIVEGKILKIEKMLVNARGENKEFKNWDITAQVEVSQFLKSGLDSEQEDKIIVHYWKPAQRPRGWTGPQGQNGWMSEGDQVRLFMTKSFSGESYHLLTPNGWEPLSEGQSNFVDEIDESSIEWYDETLEEETQADLELDL